MNELITAAAALPAAIFTALVLVVVAYWILVGIGAADIDLFHIGDMDVDAGADAHPHGFLEFLSLGRVPVTVLGTLFVLIAWMACMTGEILLRPVLPQTLAGWPASLSLGIGAAVLGVAGMAGLGRLMRPLFAIEAALPRNRVIGRQALITSLTVDDRFGTATCFIDGDEILLNVVVRDGRRLAKGDDAVVVDYDDEAGVHIVAPLRHEQAALADGSVQPPAPPPPQQIAPSASERN